ncbi:MAG: hypothetical protein WDO74_22295 [Pseudomonadota bacterium]
MIIRSTVPLLWYHLGFALEVGNNEIEESKIPLAAHGKLAHYAKSRVITGYNPSPEFLARAEEHARKPSQAQRPTTLETMQADQAKAGAR